MASVVITEISPDASSTDVVLSEAQGSSAPGSSAPGRESKRRKTAHLKVVPESKTLRESIRAECFATALKLDKGRPLAKNELEAIARGLLDKMQLAEGYMGWTMVVLASAFWKDQVAAIPPSRRLLLLPHCLKHAQGCPADYDEFGLDCKKCGACSIADFRGAAEALGYKVLVAEGSPIVLKIIVSGYVDAIVGVACLNVLEKAIDKILLSGIPCFAVPLLSSDCRDTSVDEDWVQEMVQLRQEPAAATTRSYVHLMRAASGMFQPAELARLAQRSRLPQGAAIERVDSIDRLDPIGGTEAIAYDFLARGGKYARPFITLAVHDALTGGKAALADGDRHVQDLPDAVKRAALSIETFHKASLVHDDIEDDDQYRYGEESLHRKFGAPTAINVGDYLIGLGYRLVSRESATLAPETRADILDLLADAHLRLSEGQGAELLWRDGANRRLSALDALKIYALKTAPAFEAALCTGARLAGPLDKLHEPLRGFARNLGVAFQILNDLNDWSGDNHNKLAAGGDALGGRPTVLFALALQTLPPGDQEDLLRLSRDAALPAEDRLRGVRRLYEKAGVFDKAHQLVDKHQQRAEAIADEIESEDLRRLLYYLIDTVLERHEEQEPPIVAPELLMPIVPSRSS